jgi:3-isopropylmalate/(R)-2-methylmalate dehydratase small subunit
MDAMIARGRIWKVGANVDTDQLVPGRYLNLNDPAELASHCLEEILPAFHQLAKPGDILVAGANFGCGSSREHAPIALKALGISCLVAESFARIFFRNCVNLGLPALVSPEAAGALQDGDEVSIDLVTGSIEDLTRQLHFATPPIPSFLGELFISGGMTSYVRQRLQAQQATNRYRE